MADAAPKRRRRHAPRPVPDHKKLAKLPQNAKVTKRPLLHPAIPSPYAGASQQKVVYVYTRTPFLSAVKRVEKLLRLSDKRLVQSATTFAKQNGAQNRKRKRGEEDEVLEIAREVEKQKGKKSKLGANAEREEADGVMEEVMIKGTGKAIAKVMEMGVWFQQRPEYVVRLRTGSVGAVDDIEMEEDVGVDGGDRADQDGNHEEIIAGAETGAGNDAMEVEKEPLGDPETLAGEEAQDDGVDMLDAKAQTGNSSSVAAVTAVTVPETRIRYVSTLEVAVSLR